VESCRRASRDDVGELVRLAGLMREELTAMRDGQVWLARDARPDPLAEAFTALLDREDTLVVVGTIDDAPVGLGVVEIEQLRTGDALGRISELYVEHGAREVGVGEAMARALMEFCVEKGCIGIDTFALPGHRAAKNFFEEQGFVARSITMHRSLRDGDAEA
jgi:GNAT superfamily N-acetyltransferase